MARSASAHLETDQGAGLPWLRLLAPAGKSSVFAWLICCLISVDFTVVLSVRLNLAELNVYRELFEPILQDKNLQRHHFRF
jgi:hypothetical protein